MIAPVLVCGSARRGRAHVDDPGAGKMLENRLDPRVAGERVEPLRAWRPRPARRASAPRPRPRRRALTNQGRPVQRPSAAAIRPDRPAGVPAPSRSSIRPGLEVDQMRGLVQPAMQHRLAERARTGRPPRRTRPARPARPRVSTAPAPARRPRAADAGIERRRRPGRCGSPARRLPSAGARARRAAAARPRRRAGPAPSPPPAAGSAPGARRPGP